MIIGGYQLSCVSTWSGGLPFSLSYNECGQNVNDSPNPATSGGCVPNATGRMHTGLTDVCDKHRRYGIRGLTTRLRPRTWLPIQVLASLPILASTTSAMLASTPIVDRVLLDRHGHHQGVHHSGEHRHEVPHGCVQRLQPHQPRQPGRQHRVDRHHHRRRWRMRPATIADHVSLNSLFACSSNCARSRNKPGGELRLPSSFALTASIAKAVQPLSRSHRVKLNSAGQLCFASFPLQCSRASQSAPCRQAPQGSTALPSGEIAPSRRYTCKSAQELAGKGRLDAAMAQLDQLSQQSPEPAGVERLRGMIFYQREQFRRGDRRLHEGRSSGSQRSRID